MKLWTIGALFTWGYISASDSWDNQSEWEKIGCTLLIGVFWPALLGMALSRPDFLTNKTSEKKDGSLSE